MDVKDHDTVNNSQEGRRWRQSARKQGFIPLRSSLYTPILPLSFKAFLQAWLNGDLGASCTVGSHLNFADATTEVCGN